MGKMSRDKGKTGERELAKILRSYGFEARRGVQYKGGADSPDVVGLDGVHIEVKRCERLELWKAIMQSCADSDTNEIPAVFHRKNKMPWVVILPLDGFIKLYEKGAENEQA